MEAAGGCGQTTSEDTIGLITMGGWITSNDLGELVIRGIGIGSSIGARDRLLKEGID